jgi:hypothetical protein
VFEKYQRKGVIEARPWTDDDKVNMAISVSVADVSAAYSRPATGYVARNPDNPADQWYIAPDYFAKHYEKAP